MNLFRSSNLEIDRYDNGMLRLAVYNHSLANKVNKALGGYYDDITIRKGEEPIFLITALDYKKIYALKLRGLPDYGLLLQS